MSLDPNAIASSPTVALVLALSIIVSFVTGSIVSGKSYQRLMDSLDKLTSAVDTQNALTRQALNKRNDHP